jgi:predicted enzyme related to lactoylglutathione lyase
MTLKARELGADVICGPMTVGDAGKMVLLCEPDGAMFALWQGEKHPGAKKLKEHRAMHWNELVTRNAAKSKAFYCGLFDWKTKVEIKSGMTYTLFFNVEQDSPVAGMLEMTKEWSEEVSAQWMIYFSVSDCDEYVAKTEELGGDVCVSATDIPGVGRFSVLMDPQGAVFSIIKSEMTKS